MMFSRLVHRIEELFDCLKYGLFAHPGSSDAMMIFPYLGYGSPAFINLKGRVLLDQGIKPSRKTDRIWDNLLNMYRRFESDEVPNAKILAWFQDLEKEITADEEGFFDISFRLDQPLTSETSCQKVDLELIEPEPPGGKSVRAQGEVMIVSSRADFGVISDIDDTVIFTGVTSRLQLASTILFKNAYTRLPLKGVSDFYTDLQRGTVEAVKNPLFYVSSSPWNLYDLFQEFFLLNNIPMGPIFLRDWGFERNSMLAEDNRRYKLNAIKKILHSYPDLKFILVGDSGEQDPEIYTQVMVSFPGRILCAYIRNVKHDRQRAEQIRELSVKAAAYGSQLVLAGDARKMADHALQQGWITSRTVF